MTVLHEIAPIPSTDVRCAMARPVIKDARATTTFGATDLGVVHLVIHVSVSASMRDRLAVAVGQALGAAGIVADRVRSGGSAILVDLPVRLDDPSDALVAALASWRSQLATLPIPEPTAPGTPSALATALTFCHLDEQAAGAGALEYARIDVLIAGGGDTARLTALRVQLLEALVAPDETFRPLPQRPAHAAPTDEPPVRRWATIPSLQSALVRWYRFLPSSGGDDFLARSIANVQFGGVRDSALVSTIRRRGLSYSPQSSLIRFDGREALIIDVPTSTGYETRCDEAIGDALEEFSSGEFDRASVEIAIDHLVGRTLVDADSLSGVLAGAIAFLDGADASTRLSPAELADRLSMLDRGRVQDVTTQFFAPDEFSALVLSPEASPERWTTP